MIEQIFQIPKGNQHIFENIVDDKTLEIIVVKAISPSKQIGRRE